MNSWRDAFSAGSVVTRAGVVDQDVDLPEVADHLVAHTFDIQLVRHVGGDGQRTDLLGDRSQLVRPPRDDSDLRSGSRQHGREAQPEATRCPGHHCNAVVEPKGVKRVDLARHLSQFIVLR